jgi:hypothetical protein
MARLRGLPRIRGLCRYRVLQQGRAPASVIPHLTVEAAAMAQAWFGSFVDLESAVVGVDPGYAAFFAVEEHRPV